MLLFPNAKINIGLEITKKRNDGYHDIDTIFYPVDWHDILEIVPSESNATKLTVTGNRVDCPPEKNLVTKAWHVLNSHVPIPTVNIYLHKIIPDGAGLGGGSSDAAFTLRGLNEMFQLGLDQATLAAYAAEIGADCPFFIYNKPMRATGIGNIFTPLPITLKQYTVLIVKPDISVSTKQAYQGVTPSAPITSSPEAVISLPPIQWQNTIVNKFEESVFPQFPEIKKLKQEIYNAGACYCAMSGSGASVYGIFHKDNADILSALLTQLPKNYISHVSVLQW
ncbi:4-(cytidine 5'-diphospho)-2-C-methyl-D-erythritol kinase [uncultured Muribaculum sp.]|uniref:4-(cytidine 5'-diphospho)-2-C-methyl-D-erythritol kinase n=1 Tax=uncultured Muribaculum sp. TaxID=1918613 RepID=UPI0025A94BBD|nr:4-(cytidine 5'-diphospho)-2-C-methyl-D-erythritol kinase [uncultured Muribaculum sp.]